MIERSAPVSVALNRQLIWQMAGAAHPMDAHRMESIYIAERARLGRRGRGRRRSWRSAHRLPADGLRRPARPRRRGSPSRRSSAGAGADRLMFNPLTPSEMVAAIGLAARTTARGDGELDEFDRGQLMSAYSATRHLAIEIESFAGELSARCAAIADAVDAASRRGRRRRATPARRCDAAELGALPRNAGAPDAPAPRSATLLGHCRSCRDRGLVALRGEIRTQLRALCDAEVALLADGIEAGRS